MAPVLLSALLCEPVQWVRLAGLALAYSPDNFDEVRLRLARPNGEVLNVTHDNDSNRSVTYTYDVLNRVASATSLVGVIPPLSPTHPESLSSQSDEGSVVTLITREWVVGHRPGFAYVRE